MSVIIPAHDEEPVIGPLLTALLGSAEPDELQVIVVANGCTDRTAEVAAGFRGVRVVSTPVPSKSNALRLGDAEASGFPRFYVDADVVLGAEDVRLLAAALDGPGVLAAGPRRVLPMAGVSRPVRWYYDVWQRLSVVRYELFGRGVVAVNAAGHERLADWSDVMSDDLVMAMSFDIHERVVVSEAQVVIRPPRTYPNLLRRRVRAMTGNTRLAATSQARTTGRVPRTGVAELARLAVRQPALMPKVMLFAATAVIARARARRAVWAGDQAWLRDESSRVF